MTSALITGGHGFVGVHLRALLRDQGWDVVTAGRSAREARPGEPYAQIDLARPIGLDELLDSLRPDVVFHLAASRPGTVNSVDALVTDTVVGTYSLVSSARRVGLKARIVLAGSSAQYGDVPRSENPIAESTRCRPVDAYGHAKLAAESIALALSDGASLDIIPVRPFNHVGPGQPPETAPGAYAARVNDVLLGRADSVMASGLDAVRDFTDVRDVAGGYMALAQHGHGRRIYNLCSGRGVSIRQMLKVLLDVAGLDESIVRATPSRPAVVPYQVGSPSRAWTDTGWKAATPLEFSLSELIRSVQRAGTGDRCDHPT